MLHSHRHDLAIIRHEEVFLLSEMAADKQCKMIRAKSAKANQALVETLIQDGRLVAQDETNNTLDVEQVRADDQKRFAAKIARIEALKAEIENTKSQKEKEERGTSGQERLAEGNQS